VVTGSCKTRDPGPAGGAEAGVLDRTDHGKPNEARRAALRAVRPAGGPPAAAGGAAEGAARSAAERRLVRIGLDLHDGPLQDLAAVIGEVRHFRSQVTQVLGDGLVARRLAGRVDDIEARLAALDEGIRTIAVDLASLPCADGFESSLEAAVRSLQGEMGIRILLRMEGSFDHLTDSQRTALYRVVCEAIANAHRHGQAKAAVVTIRSGGDEIALDVEDDGLGFEVEPTLARAMAEGRLGVVGMATRVELLGGTFDVTSRPGGPTRVALRLPEWSPDSELNHALAGGGV
jgi:signal transduction histidine kinase